MLIIKNPNIPVFGSISEKKADAIEYAKMYDYLPHKVEKIEQKRRKNRSEICDC